MPALDATAFAFGRRATDRLGDLLGAPLDPHPAALRPVLSRQGASELGEATPHVEDFLSTLELDFPELRLIQNVIQFPKTLLLVDAGVVQILRTPRAGLGWPARHI